MTPAPWQHAVRHGLFPILDNAALHTLRRALASDDRRLVQGTCTIPPPMPYFADLDCEGADPIGFVGWQAEGLQTVGEVESYWARVCAEMDARLGEPGGCGHLITWLDDTPRDVAFPALLAEVETALALRKALVSLEVA